MLMWQKDITNYLNKNYKLRQITDSVNLVDAIDNLFEGKLKK
jgi:hypothetical protein